jgi:hypothetical protein
MILRLRIIAVLSLLLAGQHTLAQSRYWIASSPGNWNDPANWSTATGGAGGASVPDATNVAVFNAARVGDCNLDIAPTVGGISVNGYTGTIDLAGHDLTTTGANTLATGTLTNTGAAAGLVLNTGGSTIFSGTTVSVPVTGATGRLYLSGSVFNSTLDVTKTDGNNDTGAGGNIFHGDVTLTNTGAGQLLLGNVDADQFNAAATFNNYGYRIYFAHNHGGQTTTFAGDVTLNTDKPGGGDAWSFLVCEGANSAVSFGGAVTINCAGTLQSNHRFLQGNGSQATFGGTVTINLTNTHTGTYIYMGTFGTTTYNGDIVISSTGGAGKLQ